MADLIQIQYEVVDKGKSLKTALTGVERMEKSLAKLSKEITSGTVTQDRQRKALIAYGRELKRLTGMTGTQAYGAVVKYKNALVNQTLAQNKAAIASQRLAKVQDYLASRQERATLATQKQNAALHQTKNRMNGSNMAVQQLGYQFGDFAVQVQGGTSAFVAFSQQASQLVGILPMVAGPLGLTVGAAVGLSAALGILIPIGSALARMFFDVKSGADKAKDSILSLADAQGELEKSASSYQTKIKMLEFGVDTAADAKALEELISLRKKLSAEQSKQGENALTISKRSKDLQDDTVSDLENQIAKTEDLVESNARLRAEYESQAALQKSASELVNRNKQAELDRIKAIVAAFKAAEEVRQKARDDQEAANTSAEESIRLEQQKLSLLMIEKDVGKDTGEYARIAASYESENLYLKLEQAGVSETIITRTIELLEAQQQVTAEMIASADQAERLKNNLKIASTFRVGGDMGEFADVAGGLDAFGSRGDYEYDLSRKINGLAKYEKNLRKVTKATEDAEKAAEALRKELEAPMVKAIDSVSNAFGDFIADGLKDFKSFASSIVSSFKSMIAQMIATAARNKIMLSLGMGGTAFANAAAAGNVAGVGGNAAFGPIGSFMGSFAGGGAAGTGLLGGIGSVFGANGIGLGGSFGSLGTLLSGGSTVAAGGAGFATTLGAAIPAIAAVAVVIGLFTKKTKLLDSGLRTTVEGFDVAIETFKKTQTSSLFGLLKGSKKTAYEAASAEVADPLIEAIGNMQQSIVDAAGTLGIGANAFDDFSYQFKLSLKGLTEEEQLKKINEEITKMGDSFASLTGHFETMNELLEAANQRMQLQNRLDQLLGNNAAILTRQREAELKAMHELNRPLAQAIYQLEDAQAAVAQANQVVANSFAALRTSIDAEKERLQDSFASVLDGLKERLDVVNEALDQSRNIYDMLSNALSSRQVSGEAAFAGRRSSALSFLRGGDFSDERRLENALDVVAEPSEGLFSSFIDYARDFGRTSIIIDEAKKVAQVQLTADEKQVLLLEEQIVASEANRDAQLEALDQQFQTMVDQYNALLGIDTSVKSVSAAIGTLRSAIESLASAQAASASAAKAAAAVGTGGGAGVGVQSASAAGAKVLEQLGQSGVATRASDGAQFKRINIRGSDQLLEVAKSLGIQTSGQTGAQLSQAISNAGNLGVNVDNATRAKQFAMGGYHTGGLRMVGERGPELEATGPSRIFSNNQTSGMFRDPDLKEAVNELRREVSGLRSEQRQMQASNAKYVKRNYDINRKWDVDGLPATRT